MEFFYSWVRNIVLFSLLASLALELVPSENYRNYIQLFIGFLLLFLVLEPLVNFIEEGGKIDWNTLINIDNSIKEQWEEKSQERKKQIYERELSAQIEEVLAAQGYQTISAKVEVELDEGEVKEIKQIDLLVVSNFSKAENEENKKAVVKIVREFYQLSETRIDVRVQESADGK